jgi:hypothetical protein
MRKIKLTESQLINIVKKVINEQENPDLKQKVYTNLKSIPNLDLKDGKITANTPYNGLKFSQYMEKLGYTGNETWIIDILTKIRNESLKNKPTKPLSLTDNEKNRIKNLALQLYYSSNANGKINYDNKIINPSSKRYNNQTLKWYLQDNKITTDSETFKNAVTLASNMNKDLIIDKLAKQLIDTDFGKKEANNYTLDNYMKMYNISKDGEIYKRALEKAYGIQNNQKTTPTTPKPKTQWRLNETFPLKFADKGEKIKQMQTALGVKPTGQFWLKTEEKIKQMNLGYDRKTGVTEDIFNKIIGNTQSNTSTQSPSEIPYSSNKFNYNYNPTDNNIPRS